jgi:LPS sulfotransferase NodH
MRIERIGAMTTEAVIQQDAAAARQALVICTSPRSGSYLLSEGLESTQLLGRPQEYFDNHEWKEKWWVERLGIESEADYWDKVVARGSTPNGVFGVKLHWFQLPDVSRRLAAAEGEFMPIIETDVDDCLRRRFDTVHYIWLRRRNKVAQAISYYRAVQSRIWHVRAEKKLDPASRDNDKLQFDFDQIDYYARQLEHWDERWQEYFSRKKLKVLLLIYEDFVSSPPSYEKTIREVAKFCGISDHAALTIRSPAFQRQADGLSMEWERKYRSVRALLDQRAAAAARPPAAGVTKPAAAPVAPVAPTLQVPIVLPREAAPEALSPTPAAAPIAATPVKVSATGDGDLPLIAFDLNPAMGIPIETAPSRRDWMDATPGRFVYRCLPLVIANQHGWILRCPWRVAAVWTGGDGLDALRIELPSNATPRFASSHFGFGILTFSINYIFRTPPGFNLHVRGPANMPKDGIAPLEGIVETDWTEATFTMNWKFTRPYHEIVFEAGEPFAMISPIARGEIERFEPEIRMIAEDPALEAGYRAWSQSRDKFNHDLSVEGSTAQQQGWQRHYVRGETVGQRRADQHQTGLALHDFIQRQK